MKQKYGFFFLALLVLSPKQSLCQFPDLNTNSMGFPPNTGTSPSNVSGSSSSSVTTTLTIVIAEDSADIPIINTHYKNFCIEIINLQNVAGVSDTLLTTTKQNICDRVILNSGDALKNKWLGDKMIGYLGTEVNGQSWDYNAGAGNLLAIAGNLNTNLLNNLNNNKNTCWNTNDNCQLSQTLLQMPPVLNSWSGIRNTGFQKVKQHIEAVQNSGITGLGSGRIRRMLKAKKFKKSKKSKIVYTSLEVQISTAKGKKELVKKVKKFVPDVSKLTEPEKKAFKLAEDVRIVKNNINEVIRNFRSLSVVNQQKLLQGVEINLDYAKYRCERKFGAHKCKKMNAVSYCYKCPQNQITYWKTIKTCSCRAVSNSNAGTGQNLWRRILKATSNGSQGNNAKSGLSSVTQLSSKESSQASLMVQNLDATTVNDAFFYEVDDYYRDHPLNDGKKSIGGN